MALIGTGSMIVFSTFLFLTLGASFIASLGMACVAGVGYMIMDKALP